MALNPTYQRLVVASRAERTATATFSQKYQNTRHKGLYIVTTVYAITLLPSIVPKIQGKWNLGDAWADILVDAALTGASTSTLMIYPGLTASANAVGNALLPPHWQVVVTAGNADAAEYDIVGFLLP